MQQRMRGHTAARQVSGRHLGKEAGRQGGNEAGRQEAGRQGGSRLVKQPGSHAPSERAGKVLQDVLSRGLPEGWTLHQDMPAETWKT